MPFHPTLWWYRIRLLHKINVTLCDGIVDGGVEMRMATTIINLYTMLRKRAI